MEDLNCGSLNLGKQLRLLKKDQTKASKSLTLINDKLVKV